MPKKKQGKTVIDPYGTTIVKDYQHLYKEFGIQPFKPLLKQVPNPSKYMRRNVIFGHRDFGRILKAIKEHETFAVMSGIKPTGEFHLGTLMTAQEVIYFQKQGAKAFYCIADVEAYEDNNIPFDESQQFAIGNVADILALGFDLKKGYIYQQSKERRVQDLAILFGRGATFATMKAIYGVRHIGLYLAALIQAGDILMPQLQDFTGPKPTIVPVGVDQDPHLRFTRDLARKFKAHHGFVSPSSTYHKIMRGLDGSPKMSKRSPMSYFTLHEEAESIKTKISNAFTGGRTTVKEQQRLGGVPEVCPIYEICMYQFVEDDAKIVETYHECKAGNLMCGEHKARTIERVLRFVENHRKKRTACIDKAVEIVRSGRN
jgi:tryptophanyl-tRNA synthetase